MNYIWDVMLKADSQNIKRENIIFKCADSYSPYMELSFNYLNQSSLESPFVVEVNPYYRFFSIFKEIFDINLAYGCEIRESLFDITIHYLAGLDLKQGFCKNEYYKKFIIEDINNGVFSEDIRINIKKFNDTQREIILNGILSLYKSGESLELFKKIVIQIFPKAIIYKNKDKKREILIYMIQNENKTDKIKIDTLIELFLQFDFEVFLYWHYHFGMIGVDQTMKTDQLVLY